METALQKLVTKNWNRAVPMSALFELTFVCNHACSFCYNCPTGQKEMTTAEIFEALRKLADFNVLYLTLTGGEPLVRKDFFEIARRARELGFALRIYTNGYLIDEAMAKRIKEIANPIEMEISIHGAKPETHERLTCVPGSLQRVIDAVKHLRAQGIKVNLKCPMTCDNQEEVLDMYRLAQSLEANIIFDPVFTPVAAQRGEHQGAEGAQDDVAHLPRADRGAQGRGRDGGPSADAEGSRAVGRLLQLLHGGGRASDRGPAGLLSSGGQERRVQVEGLRGLESEDRGVG